MEELAEMAGFCLDSTRLCGVVTQFLLHFGKRAAGLAVTALV